MVPREDAMKCRRCKEPAVIDVRRHNAAFCKPCFQHFCEEQVRRAIDHFKMVQPSDRMLVAVSGGKDSLALWDILVRLGYQADGLYIGLGIGDYSDESATYARDFASERSLNLIEISLPTDYGFNIPDGSKVANRAPCSACGLSKRHLFNQAALDGNYDVVATGHNLDDEAAVLLGNVLRWEAGYLGRQFPVLHASDGFVKKVKPLVRLSEREMAAYCVINRIEYILEECPMAAGNRHIGYKEMLNQLEEQSPGTKGMFLSGFFDKAHARFDAAAVIEREGLNPCTQCGAPTTNDVCAFCKLQVRASGAIR